MWPFSPPPAPNSHSLQSMQQRVDQSLRDAQQGNSETDKQKLADAYLQHAIMLRDAQLFEQALLQCQNAIAIWQDLNDTSQLRSAQAIHCSILAQSGEKDRAMRLIETLLLEVAQDPSQEPYLDSLLLHRAGLFYEYGQTSLATKDLDLALMIRKKRTDILDTDILDFRHQLLLMDELKEAEAQKAAQNPSL